MTYYRVGYNSTRSALRLSREEGRRPLSRSLDLIDDHLLRFIKDHREFVRPLELGTRLE